MIKRPTAKGYPLSIEGRKSYRNWLACIRKGKFMLGFDDDFIDQAFTIYRGGQRTLGQADMEIRILLVEDNAVESQWGCKQLDVHPGVKFHRFALHSHLDLVLEHMNSFFFDVALLDLTLPNSQGGEACMKTTRHAGSTPVIVLSGNRDHCLANSALQWCVYACLVKRLGTMDQLTPLLHGAALERRSARSDGDLEHRNAPDLT
jgi:DNA-binding NtrC family response regulator